MSHLSLADQKLGIWVAKKESGNRKTNSKQNTQNKENTEKSKKWKLWHLMNNRQHSWCLSSHNVDIYPYDEPGGTKCRSTCLVEQEKRSLQLVDRFEVSNRNRMTKSVSLEIAQAIYANNLSLPIRARSLLRFYLRQGRLVIRVQPELPAVPQAHQLSLFFSDKQAKNIIKNHSNAASENPRPRGRSFAAARAGLNSRRPKGRGQQADGSAGLPNEGSDRGKGIATVTGMDTFWIGFSF